MRAADLTSTTCGKTAGAVAKDCGFRFRDCLGRAARGKRLQKLGLGSVWGFHRTSGDLAKRFGDVAERRWEPPDETGHSRNGYGISPKRLAASQNAAASLRQILRLPAKASRYPGESRKCSRSRLRYPQKAPPPVRALSGSSCALAGKSHVTGGIREQFWLRGRRRVCHC